MSIWRTAKNFRKREIGGIIRWDPSQTQEQFAFVLGITRQGFSSLSNKRKCWGLPGHASMSSAPPNIFAAKVMMCIWWDQVSVIYYELLKSNGTITRGHCRLHLIRRTRALRKKRPQYEQRHEQLNVLYYNAEPHLPNPVRPA